MKRRFFVSLVETIQARTFEMCNTAMDALMTLIADIKSARDAGAAPGSSRPPAPASAARSSCSTSWRRRTRRGFTRRRKRRVL